MHRQRQDKPDRQYRPGDEDRQQDPLHRTRPPPARLAETAGRKSAGESRSVRDE
jgi:hypothetical protein